MSESVGEDVGAADQRAANENLDLGSVLRRLWRHRISGVLAVVLALTGAVAYLNQATYKYTASIVVVPADESDAGRSSGLAGLGSLVGVNLGGKQGSAFVYFAEAIKSQAVAETLARDERIMTTVFGNQWDPATRSWVDRPSLVGDIKQAVRSVLGAPIEPWSPPSGDDLHRYLQDSLTIIEDKEKAKLTITLKHQDRAFATYVLNKAYRETDEFLRRNSLNRTTEYADYLERRMGQVTVAEYRQSLAETLAAYEKTRMMASSNVSFAAERFGTVWVSPVPTDPAPFVILFVNATLAVILWAVVVVVVLPLIAAFRARR